MRNKAIPGWFRPWAHIEAEATTLRWWEPLVIPGLFQTEYYARAILAVRPGADPDIINEHVLGRMERWPRRCSASIRSAPKPCPGQHPAT